MQNEVPNDLIDTREAAKVAGGTHLSTIHRWIQSGKLRAYKRAGSRYRVSRQAVLDLLEVVVVNDGTPNVPNARERKARHERAKASLKAAGCG